MQTLIVNPIVKAANYQFYFNCSRRTASRFISIDRAALGKKVITFLEFYNRYGGFPDKQFNPVWKCAKTCQ